ncbi:GNAT family N-acetyltransferase [Rhizobium calliandrae]|uniref:GNAT family N-acetyltransferase n=1 Tax=Rhizobium calliandrae TaxID=1312182 RepID=A0ABT7KF95_9HYPH|nr:GNAT family N-acetyltransferase [Rhizobium calliandrae]MDL2407212.1 GNAT family N-acetyltransferase [Rhizobium calliandrae]
MYFVRTAGEQDLGKVRDLLVETWHAAYDRHFGAAKVDELIELLLSPAKLRARLAKPQSEFLVADNGEDIGGMGYAVMSEQMTKTVLLHMLYVRPSLQRNGIGRDIFAELETCFPDAEVMRLDVEPENAEAISFYEAHGFAEVGRNENAGPGQSGIPALVFEKRLVSH